MFLKRRIAPRSRPAIRMYPGFMSRTLHDVLTSCVRLWFNNERFHLHTHFAQGSDCLSLAIRSTETTHSRIREKSGPPRRRLWRPLRRLAQVRGRTHPVTIGFA